MSPRSAEAKRDPRKPSKSTVKTGVEVLERRFIVWVTDSFYALLEGNLSTAIFKSGNEFKKPLYEYFCMGKCPAICQIWTMKYLTLFMFLASIGVQAETAKEAWMSLIPENQQNREAYAFVENKPDLPNVFIYGDSISITYTPTVRSELDGEANVYRLHVNGGDSSSVIGKVDTLVRTMGDHWDFKWDVIHFNVGLHDLKYVLDGKLNKGKGEQVSTMDEYEANLRDVIRYFMRIAPGAKLIFATTTPVPQGETGRHAIDAGRYNRVALRVLETYPEIIVNDLYSFTKPHHAEWWTKPGNVHYNETGKAAQGKEVARVIREALKE
jgi:hypothetical protein